MPNIIFRFGIISEAYQPGKEVSDVNSNDANLLIPYTVYAILLTFSCQDFFCREQSENKLYV